MSIWHRLLLLTGAIAIIWLIVTVTRQNPNAFSRIALHKSVYVVGILTLLLIALIGLCILILRA